ncbi:MAG: hypothetical protein AAGD96_33530 [Chloroflexota bacterium]
MTASENTQGNFLVRLLKSEGLLGAIVAILSVLTAFMGYQGALTDAKASEHELNAQRTLSIANREYLDVGQLVVLDFISYDNYFASLGVDDEAAENYAASFSDPLIDNLEREAIFDETYYEEMYGDALVCFDEADDLFILGEATGGVAEGYQLAMFVFAVGLAMAAWASLLGGKSNVRLLFSIMALVSLTWGLIAYSFIVTDISLIPAEVVKSCLETM